jgi:hypothetical protein
VFSADIEPDLVELARQRLARIDYHPTLVAADGATGLAEHAPFDRIIATCAVPALPWAWVQQTNPGGVILTDLKIARGRAVWSASPATPTAPRGALTRPTPLSWTCVTTPPRRPWSASGPADTPTVTPSSAAPHWTRARPGTHWWCGFWPASISAPTSPSATAAPTRTGTPPSPSPPSPWATAPGRRSLSPTTRESTKSVKAAHADYGESSRTSTPCGSRSERPAGTASASPSPQTTNVSGWTPPPELPPGH